jgi:hypothetical protein
VHTQCGTDDVLALGEYRAFEPLHVLKVGTGDVGNFFR